MARPASVAYYAARGKRCGDAGGTVTTGGGAGANAQPGGGANAQQ